MSLALTVVVLEYHGPRVLVEIDGVPGRHMADRDALTIVTDRKATP